MQIAYLILAHSKPGQLARLVAKLPKSSPVLVHFDARAPDELFAEAVRLLEGRPRLKFVPRHRCYWGKWGIVAATIELIRSLDGSGEPYDYACLLSGQDYPLRSNRGIADFFLERSGAEFIESFPMLEPNRWTSDGAGGAVGRVMNFWIWFRSRRFRIPVRRKFPEGFVPHGGSQWWGLSSEALRYVVSVLDERPDLIRYYRQSFIPDEGFFQTIIASRPDLQNRVCGDDLHYVDWNVPPPDCPKILRTEDLPKLIGSNKLFARKFDQERFGDVLDLLDSRILEEESESRKRKMPRSN